MSTDMLFIVGVGRSGTKLLREILNRNPRVRIPRHETDVYPALLLFFDNNYSSGDDWFQKLWGKVSGTKFFLRQEDDGKAIDPDEWRRRIASPSAPAAMRALIETAVAPEGRADILGDKSSLHLQCIGELLRDFPGGKVIHIVRDGREVSLSAMHAWGKHPLRAIHKWTRSTLIAHAAGAADPDRYLEIHYEDLVGEPQVVIGKVCDFLEIDFVPMMLDVPSNVENLGRAAGVSGITVPKSSRTAEASADLVRRMEEIFLPAAQTFGYAPQTGAVVHRPLGRVERSCLAFQDFWSLLWIHCKEMGFIRGLRYVVSRRRLLGGWVKRA